MQELYRYSMGVLQGCAGIPEEGHFPCRPLKHIRYIPMLGQTPL